MIFLTVKIKTIYAKKYMAITISIIVISLIIYAKSNVHPKTVKINVNWVYMKNIKNMIVNKNTIVTKNVL